MMDHLLSEPVNASLLLLAWLEPLCLHTKSRITPLGRGDLSLQAAAKVNRDLESAPPEASLTVWYTGKGQEAKAGRQDV